LYLYAQALQHDAWYRRTREFLEHAQRDGRIHTLLSRVTTTGRFASSAPNLQNVDMKHFRGYLIPDSDEFVLIELDYSNAENKTGALISGDNAFAQATEGGDFYTAQMNVYWPEESKRLYEAGDKAGLKELRSRGKAVTFASAYGAGAQKISFMIRSSVEEAEAILRAKEQAYPLLTQRKQEYCNAVVMSARRGHNPAFVTLWDGARVPIQFKSRFKPSEYESQTKSASYRTWNYLQQGGVAQLVGAAIVRIAAFLRENNYRTTISINVHDSIILHACVAEVDRILPEILRIMSTVIPADLLRRTKPFIHFVSELGPENAFKWGWQHNRTYPLSLEHFYNQWGKHLLPQDQLALPPDKREAPTWVVNEAAGETLEKEWQEYRKSKALQDYGVSVEVNNRWAMLFGRYEKLERIASELNLAMFDLSMFRSTYAVRVDDPKKGTIDLGVMDFVNAMNTYDALAARGYLKEGLTGLPSYDNLNDILLQYEAKIKEMSNAAV
jgi:hypothetical protein